MRIKQLPPTSRWRKTFRLVTILLVALFSCPANTWADDETISIDGKTFYVLRSKDDWNSFCQKVKDATGNSDVNAVMGANISVTDCVGADQSYPFRGIFDGNGYKLTVEITGSNYYIAPFRCVANATIRDLHVDGTIEGNKFKKDDGDVENLHTSGLIGLITDASTVNIERVWVSTKVNSSSNVMGGFVGHTNNGTVNMKDCLFDGSLTCTSTSNDIKNNCNGSAILAWSTNTANWSLTRVYDNGDLTGVSKPHFCDYNGTPWGGNAGNLTCVSAHNFGEMLKDYLRNVTDQNSVLTIMNGSQNGSWGLVDKKAVPVMLPFQKPEDVNFELYDAVPGTESGEEGMLKIPFMCDQEVTRTVVTYTNAQGQIIYNKTQTYPKNTYAGFILVNANEAHHNLRVRVGLQVGEIMVQLDAKNDAMIHKPINLSANMLGYNKSSLTDAGAVKLTWKTADTQCKDVLDGDQFVIMRSLTGKEEDLETIGTVAFDNTITNYSFKDSTLISSLKKTHLNAQGNASLRYYVVRASVQQLWGLKNNPISDNEDIATKPLHLFVPQKAKAVWSDQTEHKVKVEWGYKNDSITNYVWDSRASMLLKIRMLRRDGTVADSTSHTLTAEQILAGQMEITLNRSCVNYQMQLIVDPSESPVIVAEKESDITLPADKLYYENLGKIDKNSLKAQTLQSSVLLTWANASDEPVDYYEVWRRDLKKTDFERLATQLVEMQYEDKTTSPVHTYEYFVRGVTSCEGEKYEDTKKVEGHCVQTGSVEGHLRFADGTGIPGERVNVTLADGTLKWCTTDESGYYRINDLEYKDATETSYELAPSLIGTTPITVTFGTEPGQNMVSNTDFIVENSIKFSGYVQYSGTSIPVQGVSFLVNGYEVHNGSGKVTTDHEGQYAFRILPNTEVTIQAVKDGHTFYQNGYYRENDNDADATTYVFTTDKAGIIFYDDTRVKLIGRICGGKDQGSIPLGNSLSRNNLGDDLQMVMALEGDNASRLVWDIQDRNKKERDEVFTHKAHDNKYTYQTSVHTTLNHMVITPDVHTGEYEVMLPPVKWKIQQITAKGYATLFQEGQVSDVIDLSDSLTLHRDTINGSWKNANMVEVKQAVVEYNAQYNRIYHSPVIIDYKQVGFDNFDYFGEHYYNYKNLSGSNKKLALAYGVRKPNWPVGKKDSLEAVYTFGYPVFSIDRKYPVKISAIEKYYYNNNTKSDTVDVIRLKGGEVTIHNGMVSSTHRDVIELDSVGEATYIVEAAQTPYLLTGESALRTVSMTLEMDGTHYEAAPLRAYVLNVQTMQGAKDVLNYETPQLIDILRDPPGSRSSATITKGSKLSYSYQMDLSWSAGTSLEFSVGTGMNNFTGVVAAPMGAGAVGGFNNSASTALSTAIDLVWSGSGSRAFNYQMSATENISTGATSGLVGAKGDVYIGVMQNIIVKPSTAIRAIPDSVFVQMGGQLNSGRLLEIAQGTDDKGELLHLVRDEVLTYGPVIKSNFIHSQNYIIKQLLPSLADQIYSLMFTGTEDEAKARAEATGEPVYLSLVDKDNPDFGTKYKMIVPSNAKATTEDEVDRYQKNMLKWVEMIAQNEKEKLTATELVQNFDVDGGADISYSEDFASTYTNTNSFISPITAMTTNYFDNAGDETLGVLKIVGPAVAKILGNLLKTKAGGTSGSANPGKDDDGKSIVEVNVVGATFKFGLKPSMSYDVKPKHSEQTSYNRTEKFTISLDKKSHLNFDVYRVKTGNDGLTNSDVHDVFVGSNFYDLEKENYEYLKRDMDLKDYTYSRGFVYRTRGGATARPWEDERQSMFYSPGTVIDERTKKIENPKISMDKQSLSGVPYGEAARFKLYLTNESETPDNTYSHYELSQVDESNPDGARLMIDGMPLTGTGRNIEIQPGVVTEKTLEVYASEKFDYQNLKISVSSIDDSDIEDVVSFDVHYLQTAGSVAILTPGDKWIMNCDAPQEKDKGWYLPVIIGGFDKNQYNFDHIELQYKESTRGEDYWTNLCGFYADSTLYAAASGTKAMIPENGNITTRFFGEGVVIEKAYDLRAVLFCRNGNNFLTNSSPVKSGIKDTRRPQLFGAPEPKDGILGAGDNLIFSFSEDIEYNYLQETTNFEVIGETNEDNVLEAPSLQFGGNGYAQSETRRNFADKNITVEVMIKPEDTGQDMPIFSHGSDGNKLQLWLTKDKQLKAVVDDKELVSDTIISFKGFKRVAMVLDNEHKKLYLYSDGKDAEMNDVVYSGYGPLIFGSTNQEDLSQRSYFEGRMLQGRIWNRAMTLTLLNNYGGHLLTGYEMGLTDYYPMNEGKGDYATDMAQGAHLKLNGAAWVMPEGMSLKLDKDVVLADSTKKKGLQLQEKYFNRSAEQDYTLMFWFKTTDQNAALYSNGSGRSTDVQPQDKFFIGFEESTLKYRSNDIEYELGENLNDDVWHHYAMTVNRVRQVASIYIDNELKAQFSTATLGGMTGTDFYLGNMVWKDEGADNDKVKEANALTGYLDGIALFKQALPLSLIKRYSTKSPGGSEKGLIVYVDFDRQERQLNGDLALKPYVLNKVIKYDEDGNDTEKRDTVFVDTVDDVMALVDQTIGAPVQAYQNLNNLNFGFVGRDNQLLVNIEELDKRINKRTIFVTVADIPDKNGNFMASPATESFYVNRNPLVWQQKRFKQTIKAGTQTDISLSLVNNGGESHTYTIDNLPRWMTVNKTSDIIDAQGTDEITLTISRDVNVGTFDHIIYLTDENGLSEPLPLELTIEGEAPAWQVDPQLMRYSMNVVGQVRVGGSIVTDSHDMVAAFDDQGRCMGCTNIKYDTNTGRSMVYLTVFDSTTVATPLSFRLWHYTTGKIMQLTTSQDISFADQTIIGTISKPIQMEADDLYLQKISLKEGWNWVSFNVYSQLLSSVSKMLGMFTWEEGNIMTEDASDLTLAYKNGKWMSNSSANIDTISLSAEYCYRIKVQHDEDIELWGTSLKNPDLRTIHVKQGWNSIGYTPMVNLPITTALAEYFDEATDGDVIKNQHEFAMFASDGAGSGEWLGTLEYMKPGEGYMLYRQKDGYGVFRYPYYEPGTTFIDISSSMSRMQAASRYASTMSVVAQAEGVELESGDVMVAYAGDEMVGESQLTQKAQMPLFYMSIEGDVTAPLKFTIERDGQIIATTGDVMTYKANAISGKPAKPTSISFYKHDGLKADGWYTIQGMKLQKRPAKRGVYINNGKKLIVK